MLGVLIAVGVIFFGVDIKRAVSDAEEAAKAAQKALSEVQKALSEVQTDLRDAKSAEESALQTGKEVAKDEKTIEAAREEVQGLLTQVRQDASRYGGTCPAGGMFVSSQGAVPQASGGQGMRDLAERRGPSAPPRNGSTRASA